MKESKSASDYDASKTVPDKADSGIRGKIKVLEISC